MAKFTSISGRRVVKAFQTHGWQVVRQKGSHIVMVKEGHEATLSVPNYNPVAKGTLRSLIRSAGLTVAEFVAAT
jgi:predicted RNA binding protein YcfA (HicA-like mRNA interferase family)